LITIRYFSVYGLKGSAAGHIPLASKVQIPAWLQFSLGVTNFGDPLIKLPRHVNIGGRKIIAIGNLRITTATTTAARTTIPTITTTT